jgi:hypothetical protein
MLIEWHGHHKQTESVTLDRNQAVVRNDQIRSRGGYSQTQQEGAIMMREHIGTTSDASILFKIIYWSVVIGIVVGAVNLILTHVRLVIQ